MGLVDQLVDPASLEAVAVEAAASLASGSLKPKRKPKALMNKLIEDNPVGRSVMWKKVRLELVVGVPDCCHTAAAVHHDVDAMVRLLYG